MLPRDQIWGNGVGTLERGEVVEIRNKNKDEKRITRSSISETSLTTNEDFKLLFS